MMLSEEGGVDGGVEYGEDEGVKSEDGEGVEVAEVDDVAGQRCALAFMPLSNTRKQ
jgi:hypothetical protein